MDSEVQEGACSYVCGAAEKQNDESARMYVSEDESLLKASGLNLEETHNVISELIYSQDKLKQLNVELQHSVELADEQNTSLHTENTALSHQLKSLKQAMHDAEKLGDELEDLRRAAAEMDVTISTQGNRIRQLERENKALKAQYENINSEMSCILPERAKNKSKIAKLSNALQALQQQLEEHRLSLDKNSYDLHEKTMIIEHLESSLEEYTTIVQELKKKNKHLEVQLEEALVFGGADASDVKESLSVDGNHPMSIGEELGLLSRPCLVAPAS
ncbi:protein KASH5-like isoform X2 [Osmerus eperlanus]|uniref:protein KASH5-like isoform X2 n=1 Tax=Osmerus eperlanus TaxID=29151 RepID=UPI002E0F5703